jgi:hypothetical protein
MRTAPLLACLALTACLPRPPDYDPDTAGGGGGVLSLEPGTIVDFGEVAVGCARVQELYATNEGDDALVLELISLLQADGSLTWAKADEAAYPWVLQPDERRLLGKLTVVGAYAIDDGSIGVVNIQSSDPDAQSVDVDVQAQVTGDLIADTFAAGHWDMDILFTLDRSGSTMDEVAAIENKFGDFITKLSLSGVAYRILGVTEIDGCQSTSVGWIDPSHSSEAAAGLFSDMVSVQPTTSVATQGLLRAENALSDEATGSGGCNQDFLRDNAMLHIIGMSDDADTSPGDAKAYVSTQASRKKAPFEVVYHGIGAEMVCGDAQPYDGFLAAASTTQGHWLSLCDGSWWEEFPSLANGLVDRADRFTYPLSVQPLDWSISVDVDGTGLDAADFSYDTESVSVVLEPSVTPMAGADVAIRYFPEPVCE